MNDPILAVLTALGLVFSMIGAAIGFVSFLVAPSLAMALVGFAGMVGLFAFAVIFR